RVTIRRIEDSHIVGILDARRVRSGSKSPRTRETRKLAAEARLRHPGFEEADSETSGAIFVESFHGTREGIREAGFADQAAATWFGQGESCTGNVDVCFRSG